MKRLLGGLLALPLSVLAAEPLASATPVAAPVIGSGIGGQLTQLVLGLLLVLVQVGEEQILLGLTPGRITPLHVLKEPVQVPGTTQSATPEFAKRLMEVMGQQKDKP